MAENFGGPVWHASARGRNPAESRRLCIDGLRGVGDASLGEWTEAGIKAGVVHIIRRLSADEQARFQVPQPYDIRGTAEERERIAAVYNEAPFLRTVMP